MPPLPMTFACGLYDRMTALSTGEVRPAGIDLNFIAVHHPRELFDRMVARQEFDASEMSASEYVTRFAAGECPFVALPAFPSRMFRHGFIAVDSRAVETPKDLQGKRIGVQLYTMTAAVWIRGLLQHDHDVDLSTIEWVEGAMEDPRPHGNPTVLPPLRPVSIVANTSGRSLSQLLEAGDIQAVIGADLPSSMRRSSHVKRLFPDFRTEEKAYYRRTGIFPIMHLVVLRREFHERHPFAATSSRSRSRWRSVACATSERCATCCPGCRPSSTRSTRCLALIPGRTASRRTGRRSRRWCASSPISR
jgi:4,5-dihydroxyphthalate decarboxylase